MEDFMSTFKRPDRPSKCTWSATTTEPSPHVHPPLVPERPRTIPNILHAVGFTPLVRLSNIARAEGLECELYAKCEFLNPGGSVKDRIGVRMVVEAERAGILKPGYTIIEPTSGNTGIGLAMACAVRGYRCVIVMPWKMSEEKVRVLRALGAEIVRTPTEAAFDSQEGLIAVSQKLQREIPNSVVLDQYTNAGNPLAHYDTTAEEILWQTEGKIDVVVISAGTGGTVAGIGRKIKEKAPNCRVIGVDPEGSILAEPEELNKCSGFYEVEGIGYDFIPTVLDRSVVDQWIKINDQDSLPLARRLIRAEGLLCGGSSGSALFAALKICRGLKKGQRCVVILPDNVRNYMTKFLSDVWMEMRGLYEADNTEGHAWWNRKVAELKVAPLVSVRYEQTCQEVLDLLQDVKQNFIGVVKDEELIGFFTFESLLNDVVYQKLKGSDKIGEKTLNKKFGLVAELDAVGPVSRIFQVENFVVVGKEDKRKKPIKILDVKGVLTARQVLAYVSDFNE